MDKSISESKKLNNTLGNYWNTNLNVKRNINRNSKVELNKINNTHKIKKIKNECKISKEIDNIWKCVYNNDKYGEYTLKNIYDNSYYKNLINEDLDKLEKCKLCNIKYKKGKNVECECINKNKCNICNKDDFQDYMIYHDGTNNSILSKIVDNIKDIKPYKYYHKFCIKMI